MSELLKGWKQIKLGEFIHLKNGYAFKSKDYVEPSEKTLPVIRISDINGSTASDFNAIHVMPEAIVAGFEICKGDLLVAMSGATTGKVGVYVGNTPAYQNQRVGNLKLNAPDFSNFSFRNYLVKYLSPTILDIAYGGAQPNISATDIENIDIVLPPQAEQTRIVEKLDEVLAQVDTIKARLDGIPAILKRFRQSVLAAAVSGRLTEEWRGENKHLLLSEDCYLKEVNHHFNNKKKVDQKRVSNIKEQDWFYNPNNLPEGWVASFLIDITHVITCGVAKKPEYTETGIRFLSAQNSKPFSPNLNGIRYISENDYKTFTVGAKPEKGDVLYSRVGANFGEACVIPWDFDFAIYVSLTLLKPIKELISGEYLTLFLNSQDGILQSRGGIMGSGIQNLNVESVRKYKLGLPSLAEQKEIVRLVDQYFAFANASASFLA